MSYLVLYYNPFTDHTDCIATRVCYHEAMKTIKQFSTRRLEALTDGVFAIAMTLLVLDLTVPNIETVRNSSDLFSALAPLSGNIISFTISFAILAIMWSVHVRQFDGIKRIDERVLTLNNLRLFVVVLIPFTTSLLGEYNNIRLAEVLYPLSLFALALVTVVQGTYLDKHPNFFENFDKAETQAGNQRSLGFAVTAGVVVIASIFVGSFAYFLFFLSPFVPRFMPKRV